MAERPGFDWGALTMGQKGILIMSALLFVNLFLPWQRVCFLGTCVTATNGWAGIGVIAGLLVIATLVWEGLNVFGALANVNVSVALVGAALAGGAAVFTVIRALTGLTAATFGTWLGILFALALGYAAYVRFQESQTPGEAPPPAA